VTVRAFLALLAILLTLLPGPAVAQSILRDAETEAFFRDISRDLVLAAGLEPNNVHFILVGDNSINAFVTGGQNVFIHSGLIIAADNVNELQGVIAHELGHIAAGHNVRFNEGAGPASRISILSLIGAVAAMAAGAGEAGMAILGMGQTAAMGKFLAFTRDQESRTDQAGAVFLSKAGISGRGSIDFFKKLQNQEFRLAIPQNNEYVRTHPLSGTRISNLLAVYEKDAAWNKPADPRLQARFERIKGKLIGFVEEPRIVMQKYPDGVNTPAALYARAYAWHRSGYPDQAMANAAQLVAKAPDDPFFLELQGQILLESGKVDDAIPVLRHAADRAPFEPMILTLLGHALVSSETPALQTEAEPLLKKSVALDRENPFTWYQLGVIYDRRGDKPRAALAAAERFSLEGNAMGAMMNARLARAALPAGSPDFIRADDIMMVAGDALEQQKKKKR
jgi:predicted Zn-dependent protease